MTEIKFDSGASEVPALAAVGEVPTEVADAAEMPAGAGPMTHCNLMMPRPLLARLDRLRACTGESRSRVVEAVLTRTTLDRAEKEYAAHIEDFGRLAAAAGVDWIAYAQAYATAFARQTYPPTVFTIGQRVKGAEFRKAIDAAIKAARK